MKKYLVGGAVRDTLLGKNPNDKDYVVVGSTPKEMLDAGFSEVGAAFPVFLHPETGDEYALARKERKTGTGHTGFSVEFDPTITLTEDLSRRDLTINAMAIDQDTGEVVDPYGGKADLEAKVLRHVGTAFAEDPLRVVRLARFYARFTDFEIAEETVSMCREIVLSGEMDTLSNERYWAEMRKMFETSTDPMRFFHALMKFGALNSVKFFKDAFGTVNHMKYFGDFPGFLDSVMKLAEPENRMEFFVSLAAFHDAQQVGQAFPLRIAATTKHLRVVREMHVTAKAVFDFVTSMRGWNTTPSQAMRDLISVMVIGDAAGEVYPLHHFKLVLIAEKGSQLSAESYMHLSGKEIGQRLAEDRMNVVRELLEELVK